MRPRRKNARLTAEGTLDHSLVPFSTSSFITFAFRLKKRILLLVSLMFSLMLVLFVVLFSKDEEDILLVFWATRRRPRQSADVVKRAAAERAISSSFSARVFVALISLSDFENFSLFFQRTTFYVPSFRVLVLFVL
jgi:hypothetical protein